MDLDSLRATIDRLDREILERLNARAKAACEVGRVKQACGDQIYVPSREEAVFQRLLSQNEGPLDERAIRSIYREIISASIALEKRLNIAYLGPEATFTQQAAVKNFGTSVTYHALPTIPDVFTAVEKGEADYGVIPIENSNEGGVFHSMDMLVDSELKIVAQVYLPIEHCLISMSPLDKIQSVHSKDQALGQCREWLRRHLPYADQVATASTSHAVELAREKPGAAAVASRLAAELYEVPVVENGIQDRADNITRFLVVGPEAAPPCAETAQKTSLVISINDEAGALSRALEPFSSRGLNLTKIESRPSRRRAWDYVFFIDCQGHWEDPLVQEAVAELKNRCPLVKWLGSYPAAG